MNKLDLASQLNKHKLELKSQDIRHDKKSSKIIARELEQVSSGRIYLATLIPFMNLVDKEIGDDPLLELLTYEGLR